MNSKSLDEQKKLNDEAHAHRRKVIELFEDAARINEQAHQALDPHEKLLYLKEADLKDSEAIAEAHRVREIEKVLIGEQRADNAEELKRLQEMEKPFLITGNAEKLKS